MVNRHHVFALLVMIASTPARAAPSAETKDFPPALKPTVECMLNVLKATPGVDNATLQMSPASKGSLNASLEYRFSDESAGKATIGFHINEHNDKGRIFYDFTARLSGLSTPGTKPNDWGTREIVQKWKAQCDANASVLFI